MNQDLFAEVFERFQPPLKLWNLLGHCILCYKSPYPEQALTGILWEGLNCLLLAKIQRPLDIHPHWYTLSGNSIRLTG
jgi:hypothetical protein